MANPEHLDILKEGVKSWNIWRGALIAVEGGYRYADLSGADLAQSDLSRANLSEANLSRAKLTGAILKGTDLKRTDLRWTDLRKADLSGAYLEGSDLRGSNFSGAKLCGADLAGLDLSGAVLTGADISNAMVGRTLFGDIDLSQVKGLQSVHHFGPSTIGIDTIYESNGNIPEEFLRGAGVPEPFITHMKALVGAMEPIQFYSCFISYSAKDQDFADRVHADLRSKHVRCWLATEDLKIGEKFRTRIEESIRVHEKLLLVLSKASLASPWVEDEVESALARERREGRLVLFPIRIDDAVWTTDVAWAVHLRQKRHIGEFSRWKDHDAYQKAFERLLRDLKADARSEQNKNTVTF